MGIIKRSKINNILKIDGNVYYFPNFFTPLENNLFFHSLYENIEWKQESIKIFGKMILQPRLTAWYGDKDKCYSYSGITYTPELWTKDLLKIKDKIQNNNQYNFNSALLNLYRNGQDSMGWHRDNERELGAEPVIGSVSFGATRKLCFKHMTKNYLKLDLEIQPGSLLVMEGKTQKFWKHSIPKDKNCSEPRINITFRFINN